MSKALDESSIDHPVFYEDEVNIHLNLKIEAELGLKSQQRKVAT